jgi:hypothetical protein
MYQYSIFILLALVGTVLALPLASGERYRPLSHFELCNNNSILGQHELVPISTGIDSVKYGAVPTHGIHNNPFWNI